VDRDKVPSRHNEPFVLRGNGGGNGGGGGGGGG